MDNFLVHPDWNPEVKKALNDFLAEYGKQGKQYDPSSYVVSDSDNTISIFDVEHQRSVYQLMIMAFAFDPEEMEAVLLSGLKDADVPYAGLTLDGKEHTYRQWAGDITDAYRYLYNTYGPFTCRGVEEKDLEKMHQDPYWLECAAKMRAMYALITKREDGKVSCPWLLYWFCGMSEQEVYDLGVRSHRYFKEVPTETVVWTSPAEIPSRIGSVEASWTSGIQVTENIRELFHALKENGIDVWVCSASGTDTIRASLDVFGLHNEIKGMMAMTVKLKDGIYEKSYDYEHGCAWLAQEDGTWVKDTIPTGAETQGTGKSTAIRNVLYPRYGHGPLAGFGDSTGDFSFCTSFSSMKLAVIFNRADRSVADGGGLLAEIAVYEADELGYDLKAAEEAGDILYVLQGRDENGMRTFRNSRDTVRIGATEEKRFADLRNVQELAYMKKHSMTVRDALNFFAVKTEAGEELNFCYGFLNGNTEYRAERRIYESDT